jgi:vacuolar-type H+-ATPase subunit E/Vma4|tara:strand:+ start:1185 stop:1457 length:273 start_codon:yes stop_codon:yes gene_type:complete
MSEELFDFGFTTVDESELNSYQQATEAKAKVEETAQVANATQEKVDALYNAIQPLLNNLKANPSKEYILWPNRLEKIEQFETYLQGIYTK